MKSSEITAMSETHRDAISTIEHDIIHLEGIHDQIVELVGADSEISSSALFGLQKGIGTVIDGLRAKHSIIYHGTFGKPRPALEAAE